MMSREFYFITHPNVVVSADVPVPRWPLSARGRERMTAALALPWVKHLSAIYCSAEQKAMDGAEIVARHLGLCIQQREDLGENDRSSTGYLPPTEFEAMADSFFACPDESVRGWEPAADAQRRIVRAVSLIAEHDRSGGPVAIISHGAVGTLLYCHFSGLAISRHWDQPANGGGNFFTFGMSPPRAISHWQAIDSGSL
jgi:broad specificity phosphatase PhoE